MNKNINYDPQIIQTSANALYAQANSIILTCTILGALFGVMLGGVLGYFISSSISSSSIIFIGMFIGALILGMIGLTIGRNRAFTLKLEAQTALCQMHIELNTNK